MEAWGVWSLSSKGEGGLEENGKLWRWGVLKVVEIYFKV